LDGQDLNALFAGLDEPPITIQFPEVRTDISTEVTQTLENLASTFNEIALMDFVTETGIDITDTMSKIVDGIKENKGNIIAGRMISESMYPKIPKGLVVPIETRLEGISYEVGEMVLYQKGSDLIVHCIADIFIYQGKTHYVMEGINRETNPFVDRSPIAEDQIIGLVIDSSKESMDLLRFLSERGIISQYDVLGMPDEFDKALRKLSNIDGQEFTQSVKFFIAENEKAITQHLQLNPQLEHILRGGEKLYGSNAIKDNGEFRKYGGEIPDAYLAAILDISVDSFQGWLKGKNRPVVNTLIDIHRGLINNFGSLNLKIDGKNIKMHEYLFEIAVDIKTEIIVRQLKSVLVDGEVENKPYTSSELINYFGRQNTAPDNIQAEIFELLKNSKTGNDLDSLLGTDNLFQQLLGEYKTSHKKKKIAKVLYYLSFGTSQTNYQKIKDKVKSDGIMKLLTTHFEFLDMILRKDIINDDALNIHTDIYVDMECLDKEHSIVQRVTYIGKSHYGCPKCNNYKNEKISTAMVYELFEEARKNGNIIDFKFKTQETYHNIFGKQTVDNLQHPDAPNFDKSWHSYLWTCDICLEFTIDTSIGPKKYTLGVESDGLQHQDSEDGYNQWRRLNRRGPDSPKNRDDWKRFRINVDRYKNSLFLNDPNKFLIRIPTYAGQGSVGNRMFFIIWCFSRLTGESLGVHYSDFDHIDESTWLAMFDTIDKRINKKP
jgi:hypothetical protein